MLDVLIKNGNILDGTGKEPVNCDIGLIAIGNSCFGPVCVNGLNLVPCPPCKIIPFISFSVYTLAFN